MIPKEIQDVLDQTLKHCSCKKRKVAAVIVDNCGGILSSGTNYNPEVLNDGNCEDNNGKTFPYVIHAEVAAIQNLGNTKKKPHTIYVTHKPCDNCATAIIGAGIDNVIVSEQFMKFDTGKLRYGLIPPEATKALAEVLTYGAKKYKPNNWREVDDATRYIDALYRHLEAWRSGEEVDEESGLPHLAHALTNVSFLIALNIKN